MILAGQLDVGPLQWTVQVPDGGVVRYSDPAYAGFWRNADHNSEAACTPLVRLPVTITRQALQIPASEPLYCGGKNWAIWSDDSHLIICSGFHQQSAARFHCRLSRDFSHADVALDPAREGVDGKIYDGPLRYPIDQILSWGMLSRCGGMILHASVAVKDGAGWVFAGRSGAGKSTMSSLCHAEGWKILNDDRVMLYQRNGKTMVAGTPWHGSGRFAEAMEVPLGGIYFLKQAVEDRVEIIDSAQARLSLLDIAAIPWFEDDWSGNTLQTVDSFTKSIPFHRFHFTKSPSAVRAIEMHQHQNMSVAR